MAFNKYNYYLKSFSNAYYQQNYFSMSIQHLCISNLSSNDINHNLLHPEIILNTNNRKACIERLKKLFSMASFTKNNQDTKNAAVLIPLCLHDNELGFLYTLRSKTLSTNGGQVSFPGGIKDNDDENYEMTALRETWEELGIPNEKVDVWTSGNFIGRKDVNVMPILGYVGEIDLKKLKINHREVEEAFVVSLKHFCDQKYCRYTQFRTGYTLPVFLKEGHKIWGLTALITHMTMCALIPDIYRHKLKFLRPIEKITGDKKVDKLFT
ncbi:nucleoside diphosphate-linked moiety X motif 8 [Chelonus insularis]|uniref:nucleoside diphosphate-linked moiety X motif 8 n=1 Tax=Chelonus insularis TaxID=460826 RepID=UPI00158DAD32|nr:nucleoside diphosphate-linked moiety X motif 8 [Chelonus insularis]